MSTARTFRSPTRLAKSAFGTEDEAGFERAFKVEVLFNHALSADLKVSVRAWFTRASPLRDVYSIFDLFVKIGLQKGAGSDGHGLATASLSIELVDVQSNSVTNADFLHRLKPFVDQTLDLGGLGTGGRIDDVALRKFPKTDTAPASLSIYLNLVLRSGPAIDHFFPARGDVLMGQNILPEGEDMVFASRKDLYVAMTADAWYRRAVPSGSGYAYAYPLHFKNRDGTLLNITITPATDEDGLSTNRLRIEAKAEIEINNLPNPDATLLIDIFGGVDSEGVMTWSSASTAHLSSLLYEVAEVLAGGVVAAIVPAVGPAAALVVLHYTEEMILESFVGDKVKNRLDATLLDIAPNRLTMFRKRWDPFYETQHQIGLRPGGTAISADGIALWGRAVLTKTTKPISDVVIRDSEHVADEAPTALRYRVPYIDNYPELKKTAPGTDRLDFARPDPSGEQEPYLVQISVANAIARITQSRLLGAIPYTVERIEAPGKPANKLLVISRREWEEERERLIEEHTNAVTPQIWADHEAAVRTQVLADFAALGLFPTSEEIETAVAAGIQPFIKANVDAYVLGPLTSELDAALLPLLRFELAQTHFGKLQKEGVLIIKYFDLVHFSARDTYYYRDHYVAALEDTPAKRVADNLHSKPRYRSTPEGPVFLDS